MAALPVFLLLCLAVTGLCEHLHKRIINGNDAAHGSHPYMVAIMKKGKHWGVWYHHCGGTLISRDWVLTAARCTKYR